MAPGTLPAVPGTANVRDLLPADVGRPGVMWRADALCELGVAGRHALHDLGIRTVIDLREPVEEELDPDDLADLPVRVLSCPVLEGGVRARTGEDLGGLYRRMLDACGFGFARAVNALAASETPVLVHCSAGKDRTGLLAALVLATLGVDEEAIVVDYARSEDMLGEEDSPVRQRILRRAVASGLTEQQVASGFGSPPEAMRAALEHVRAAHGGARGYLGAHGVADASLEAVARSLGTRPPRPTPDQPSRGGVPCP